jgi:hypothetical protein
MSFENSEEGASPEWRGRANPNKQMRGYEMYQGQLTAMDADE